MRKPEIAAWGRGARDERFTSQDTLDRITLVIGPITVDPCGHPNALVQAEKVYYLADDGLRQPWWGTVFVNPPYSATHKFVEQAKQSWQEGAAKVVLILAQTQTHHRWFYTDVVGSADVFFVNGRLAFEIPGKPLGEAPFGNMFLAYGFDERMIDQMLSEFDCVHLPRAARIGRAAAAAAVWTLASALLPVKLSPLRDHQTGAAELDR